MPYKVDHACRLRDPDTVKVVGSGERDHEGKKYRVIFAKPKDGGGSVEQAYRYPKKTWTAAEARKHCAAHDGTFEAASNEALEKFLDTILSEQAEQIWRMKDTDQEKTNKVFRALQQSRIFGTEFTIVCTFESVAVIYEFPTGKYFAVEYAVDEAGDVALGEFIEVDLAYVPAAVQEALRRDVQVVPMVEQYNCTLELVEEADGKGKRLKGQFIEANRFNTSMPRRMYPDKIIAPAVAAFNEEKAKLGLDGHKEDGGYADVVLLHEKLWMEGDVGYFSAEIVPDTEAGKVITFLAERKIPIAVSLNGRGKEIYEKETVDKTGLKGGFVVQEGYFIERLDAVLKPAFENAKALMEQQQTIVQNEGGNHMDELKKLIEALTQEVNKIKDSTTKLEAKQILSAEDTKTLTEMKARMAKDAALLEARKRAVEILGAPDLKDFEFRDALQKHLEKCESVEEVNTTYPRIMETLNGFKGQSNAPAAHSVTVLKESGLFGAARPKTPLDVYTTILNRFKDNGLWPEGNLDLAENRQSFAHMDNPRWVAKTLIDNYLKLYVNEGKFFSHSNRNPLRWLIETAGDDEFYTGDVAQTAAALLPLYVVVLEDWMAQCSQAFGTLPLTAPQGKVFFQNEYYNTGTGTWAKINRANFLYTRGQKAEGAAGQIIKIKFESDTVDLETALKYLAEWTPEAMQDAMAYYRTSIENPHVQAMKNETLRSLSYQAINKLITQTSCAHNDACIEATGSPLEFSLTPDALWTGGDWIKTGFTRFIKQLDALIVDRDADTIIIPKALRYLFSAPEFVADTTAPTSYGFTRVGTYQASYKVFVSTIPTLLDNKIAMLHRGSLITDAAHLFLPYVLFYLGNLVDAADGSQSRMLMSRFGIQKVWGQRIAFGNIVP